MVPRLRDSHVLASSGCGGAFHATSGPVFSQSLHCTTCLCALCVSLCPFLSSWSSDRPLDIHLRDEPQMNLPLTSELTEIRVFSTSGRHFGLTQRWQYWVLNGGFSIAIYTFQQTSPGVCLCGKDYPYLSWVSLLRHPGIPGKRRLPVALPPPGGIFLHAKPGYPVDVKDDKHSFPLQCGWLHL